MLFSCFILFCCKFSAFFITTKTFSLFFFTFLKKSWEKQDEMPQKGDLFSY